MTVLSMKPRESDREGRLQSMHAVDQVWLRCLKAQMVVVAHDCVGVHTPGELLTRFAHDADERSARTVRRKDIVLKVPRLMT